uniref:Uncharacterized protein n=1 Tax=Oncorhynchus tshawytscha TaxID=74940 RepID=A0AAZ3PTJ1_ONCTS
MNISENGAVGDAITVHDISEKILEQTVHFHVMKFHVFFAPLVRLEPRLVQLGCFNGKCVCIQDSMPLSTLVLEDPSETTQNSLAQKLTTRTKKRVFVSYNLPMTDSNLSLLVENRIKKEMEVHMDTFESFPHLYRLFTKIIQWREQHYLPV